jgi:GNAT superfamily N-acetyltransferase
MRASTPRIETARAADLDDVVALLGAQFREHDIDAGDIGSAALGLIEDASRGAVFLATVDTARVGIAAMPFTWTLEHGGKVAWLDELYVVPAHRGAGLGTLLLDHALAFARAAGCLAVDADHERVGALYLRKGFQRLPRTRWALKLT